MTFLSRGAGYTWVRTLPSFFSDSWNMLYLFLWHQLRTFWQEAERGSIWVCSDKPMYFKQHDGFLTPTRCFCGVKQTETKELLNACLKMYIFVIDIKKQDVSPFTVKAIFSVRALELSSFHDTFACWIQHKDWAPNLFMMSQIMTHRPNLFKPDSK